MDRELPRCRSNCSLSRLAIHISFSRACEPVPGPKILSAWALIPASVLMSVGGGGGVGLLMLPSLHPPFLLSHVANPDPGRPGLCCCACRSTRTGGPPGPADKFFVPVANLLPQLFA